MGLLPRDIRADDAFRLGRFYAGCPEGIPCLKTGSLSFFSFVVVTNVHLSIINSFYMYKIQFSPRGDIYVSYCPFNRNGPIRTQYLSVCQEGSDGS